VELAVPEALVELAVPEALVELGVQAVPVAQAA
jgi:hypothetical protein